MSKELLNNGAQFEGEQPLVITPNWPSRQVFLEQIASLLARVQEGCADYKNTTSLLPLSDQVTGVNGRTLSWSLDFDLKNLCVFAAIVQAPLLLAGSSDTGKTALAKRVLNSLFGPQKTGWWMIEVNRQMTLNELIEIDTEKTKLSEIMSQARWVSLPARLVDEFNRAHPKVLNLLLHVVDEDHSEVHAQGDLTIPIGLPYRVNGAPKRYSFSILTANEIGADMPGVFEVDAAMMRRIKLSHTLDDTPVHPRDLRDLSGEAEQPPAAELPVYPSMVESIIAVNESLAQVVPLSALARLFLHYLWGLGTCIRTRTGRQRRKLLPGLCASCHLAKANQLCGRVGGLSEGLFKKCKTAARGIAAIRAAKVLESVRQACSNGAPHGVQELIGSSAEGEALYRDFAEFYTRNLCVQGEDVVAAYTFLAPRHVWISPDFLNSQAAYEKCETYAFADIAARSWRTLQETLRKHEHLFTDLAQNGDVSPAHQAEVEALITTENPAMLAVIAAFRDEDLSQKFSERLRAIKAA